MRILLLDDGDARELLAQIGRAMPGSEVRSAPSDEAQADAGLIVVGPGVADPVAVVRRVRDRVSSVPVVVVSDRDQTATAVAVMKAGASDWMLRADCAERLPRLVERAPTRAPDALCGLVGTSPSMEQVRQLVRTAARAEAHVLIEGETGTGKEVVARAIHALGRRSQRPFVPVNCAAIPETLAESEFFGHARGAFTGAMEARPGALRLADGGTLFLDEIEDLPLSLQAKLLRVVQDREVRPLGGSTAKRVDVRIVAASNRELWRMVESGAFRRDLFYRLRILTIALPPLRERRVDLPLLIAHFVDAFNRRHATAFRVPAPAALRPLLEHPWPGNVRELENALESLLLNADAAGEDLAQVLRRDQRPAGTLWADERTHILRVLDDNRWNRQRAAAALGISRVTLWRRMERHGIRDPLVGGSRETA
jgi:two-component system NtrC family response regulator